MKNPILDYLKDDNFENEEFDTEKKNLIKLIKEINLQLAMSGFDEISDLFDGSFQSISKTVSLIYALVNDRQKILEAKAELNQKNSRLEIESVSYLEKMENSKEKLNEQININTSFKNKMKSLEIKHNEEIDKIRVEKDDYLKAFNRINLKENHYKHEIKKLEKEIENTKVKMNKILSEKKPKSENNLNTSVLNNSMIGSKSMNNTFVSSHPVAGVNNILLTENLKENIAHSNTTSQKEFYSLINKAFNDKINLLLNENEQIRECLKIIYKEIYQYIDFKKLVLLKFTKDVVSQAEFREISEQINNKNLLKQEIFNLNFEDVKDQIYNSFNDTLIIFRKYLVYDILKVDPKQEFNFDPNSKVLKNNKFDYNLIPYFDELKKTFENKRRELIEKNKFEQNLLGNYNFEKYDENLDPFSFVFSEEKYSNCHEKIDNLIEKMKNVQKKLNDCDTSINNLDQKVVKISSSEEENKKKGIEDYNLFAQKIREKCMKMMENLDH